MLYFLGGAILTLVFSTIWVYTIEKDYKEELRDVVEIHEEVIKLQEDLTKEIVMLNNRKLKQKDNIIKGYKDVIIKKNNEIEELKKNKEVAISRNKNVTNKTLIGTFDATAYDLSVASCGKSPSDEGYGITATGKSLVGLNRASSMSIAVDPNIIPLGSKVYLQFGEGDEKYNGTYIANDTGGAVKGNIIDVYMGESYPCFEFGRKKVKVYKIN